MERVRHLVPALDDGDDLVGTGGPGKWLGLIVGLGEEAIDRGLEFDDRPKHAAPEARLLSFAKKPSTAFSHEHEVGA